MPCSTNTHDNAAKSQTQPPVATPLCQRFLSQTRYPTRVDLIRNNNLTTSSTADRRRPYPTTPTRCHAAVTLQQHQKAATQPRHRVRSTTHPIHHTIGTAIKTHSILFFFLIFATTTAILFRRPLKDYPTVTNTNIDKDQQQQQHKATKSSSFNKTNKLQRRRITAYILQRAPYTKQSEPQSKHTILFSFLRKPQQSSSADH